jgi:serine/threonine protein kinase
MLGDLSASPQEGLQKTVIRKSKSGEEDSLAQTHVPNQQDGFNYAELNVAVTFQDFFGNDELGRQLGENSGQGAVFIARQDRQPCGEYVVKVPHPQVMQDEGLKQRFLLEGEIAAGVPGEKIAPFITYVDLSSLEGIYETTGYTKGSPVVGAVYKYIEGPTLSEVLKEVVKSEDPLAYSEKLITIFKGVLKAVNYLHSRGVIHRDLKPHNIVCQYFAGSQTQTINDIEDAWVIDLGLAKVDSGIYVSGVRENASSAHIVSDKIISTDDETDNTAPNETKVGTVMGSFGYISPEQAKGLSTINKTTDIFSLGCIFYEILCNEKAFEQKPSNISVYNPPKFPVQIQGKVDPILASIVMKMIKEEPSKRYQSLAEVLLEVDNWSKNNKVHAYLESEHVNLRSKFFYNLGMWIKSHPRVTTAILSAASILGGTIFYNSLQRRETISNLKLQEGEVERLVSGGNLNSAISELNAASVKASENSLDEYYQRYNQRQLALEQVRKIREISKIVNIDSTTLIANASLIPIDILKAERDIYEVFTGEKASVESVVYRDLFKVNLGDRLKAILASADLPDYLANEIKKELQVAICVIVINRFSWDGDIPLSLEDSKLAIRACDEMDNITGDVSLASVTIQLKIIGSNSEIEGERTLENLKNLRDSMQGISSADYFITACCESRSGLETYDTEYVELLLKDAKSLDFKIASLSNFLCMEARNEREKSLGGFNSDAMLNYTWACKDLEESYYLAEFINYIVEHPTKYFLFNIKGIDLRVERGLKNEINNLETTLHLAVANYAMYLGDLDNAENLLSTIKWIRDERSKRFGVIEEDPDYLRTLNRHMAKVVYKQDGYYSHDVLSKYASNIEKMVEVAKLHEGKSMPKLINRIVGEYIFVISKTLENKGDEADKKANRELEKQCVINSMKFMRLAIDGFKENTPQINPKDKSLSSNTRIFEQQGKHLGAEFNSLLQDYLEIVKKM